MKLYIKNMVCSRCKMVVKSELEKLGLHPIAAAVVTDTDCPTVIAGIDMSAQGGRPAFFDSMQYPKLPAVQSQFFNLFTQTIYDIGYFNLLHCSKSVSSGLKMRWVGSCAI